MADQFPSSHIDIPKKDNGQFQKNGRWIIPFNKFSRLMVNESFITHKMLRLTLTPFVKMTLMQV